MEKMDSVQPMKSGASKDHKQEKLVAALTYVLVGIIWFFLDEDIKKSGLVKFHVKQALNLLIVSIGVSIVFSFLSSILLFIPIIGWFLILVGAPSLSLASLILAIIGIVNGANGKEKAVPLVGQLADKYLKF